MKPFSTKSTLWKVCTLSVALSALLVAVGCRRDSVDEPGPPTGPSGGTYYVNIYASPSVLPSNTGAISTITAILRKYDGSPMVGKPMRFEITDGFNQITGGSLSVQYVNTDSSGVARTTYTVPKYDVEGFLRIRATWIDSPWTERYYSTIPLSLRYKGNPPTTNEYPTATFTIVTPGPYDVNQEITFDGHLSFDPDGVIVHWVWDFGDARALVSFEKMENESPMLNQPIVTHRFKKSGSYVITLKVIDNGGLYNINQQIIKVGVINGTAPTSCFNVTTPLPGSGAYLPDTDIQFDGTCSSDSDGAVRRWDWNWGDGKYSYNGGYLVTHRWHDVGQYPISLTVTDDSGLKGISAQNILISLYGTGGPTASFVFLPTAPNPGDLVTFDATASTDTGGAITGFSWTFGDGNESHVGPITQHSYREGGNYPVLLTVTDNNGLQGVAGAVVPVGGSGTGFAPTACFSITPDPTSSSAHVGDPLKFDGTCSTDPDGQVVAWRWDLGDGTIDTTSGPIVTHAYSISGLKTVFLTVHDDTGLVGVISQQFTITIGDPPVANAGSDQSFSIGLGCIGSPKTVSFNGAGSTDLDGTISFWNWDFGDGFTSGNLPVPSVTHAYTVTSTTNFNVTLTVTDNDGLTDTDSCVISIACT